MKPLYIFDLDGTLALIDHRRPILDDLNNPNRWDDFYEACDQDEPNLPVIKILRVLSENADIAIWSGRSKSVMRKSMEWVFKYVTGYSSRRIDCSLSMRIAHDSAPDQDLKRRWYEELPQEDKDRLVATFDDRQKVVDMWRSLGITCLQVAPGNF